MKLAIIALVLAVSLAQTEAYWGYGYGGLYGGYYGGLYGGLYGGYWGGLYGGYGYGYWGKRDVTPPTEVLNRTECIFSNETRMLSCHGPRGIVECSTEVTWTEQFDFRMFGLGLYTPAPSPMKYRVLPRKLDNSGWESASYTVDGQRKYASLYSEGSESGLRVVNRECFVKLIDLIALSNRRELVEVESEQVYVIGDLMWVARMPSEKEEKSVAERDEETRDSEKKSFEERYLPERDEEDDEPRSYEERKSEEFFEKKDMELRKTWENRDDETVKSMLRRLMSETNINTMKTASLKRSIDEIAREMRMMKNMPTDKRTKQAFKRSFKTSSDSQMMRDSKDFSTM